MTDLVTVSPKFQVVIPKALREQLGLVPGQKLQAMVHEGRIELVPVEPATALRGFMRGSDIRGARDRDKG